MKLGNLLAPAALLVALFSMPGQARVATMPLPVPTQYQSELPDPPEDWSPESAALGKRLFQDRILSKDHTISCQDCHKPELAFTDGKPTARGMKGHIGPRNTPSIVNRALGKTQFWDGRAASLVEQALGPIAAPGEMDLAPEEAAARLEKDASYRAEFRKAFGADPTPALIAQALAAYESTVFSIDAPFDRYLAGDKQALSPLAQQGLTLFGGKARCSECHSGPNFTDELFHCLGLPGDKGRGGVAGHEKALGEFKTPSLREIALTAPYMHDGSVPTLAEVVEVYDRGGTPHPNLSPKMTKLGLTAEEKKALVAFMESLSGRMVELEATQQASR
jgi:cytochrome c peroxidase